jgi:hypothetical protein
LNTDALAQAGPLPAALPPDDSLIQAHENSVPERTRAYARCFFIDPGDRMDFLAWTTPYFMEMERDKLLKDKRSDGGSYDTRFKSHTPMDFSVWHCYKTGAGSPAIVCDLIHKATEEESAAIVKSEKEQEERSRLEEVASDYLMVLKPATLLEACGQGEQSGGQSKYSGMDRREDTNIKYAFAEFQFEYLGMNGTPAEPFYMLRTANATGSYKYWDISAQVEFHERALEIVQAIPCLFSQVQMRSNQHLPRDRAANAHGVPLPEF